MDNTTKNEDVNNKNSIVNLENKKPSSTITTKKTATLLSSMPINNKTKNIFLFDSSNDTNKTSSNKKQRIEENTLSEEFLENELIPDDLYLPEEEDIELNTSGSIDNKFNLNNLMHSNNCNLIGPSSTTTSSLDNFQLLDNLNVAGDHDDLNLEDDDDLLMNDINLVEADTNSNNNTIETNINNLDSKLNDLLSLPPNFELRNKNNNEINSIKDEKEQFDSIKNNNNNNTNKLNESIAKNNINEELLNKQKNTIKHIENEVGNLLFELVENLCQSLLLEKNTEILIDDGSTSNTNSNSSKTTNLISINHTNQTNSSCITNLIVESQSSDENIIIKEKVNEDHELYNKLDSVNNNIHVDNKQAHLKKEIKEETQTSNKNMIEAVNNIDDDKYKVTIG
jgi:hypothetical protein